MNIIENELIKRYEYLYMNKEYILAWCIRREFIKTRTLAKEKISELKNAIRELKEFPEEEDLNTNSRIESYRNSIDNYYEMMHQGQLYLYKDVEREIVSAFEEFLFTDDDISKTIVYKYVESLKSNHKYLESVKDMLNELENRRTKEKHLKDVPTFTVWKILDYVRRNNKNNYILLSALDKYYNLDRYVTSGEDWESGYVLIYTEQINREDVFEKFPHPYLATASLKNGVKVYHGENEFEEEDNYFAKKEIVEIDISIVQGSSKFMRDLSILDNLDVYSKEKVYNYLKGKSRKKLDD